MTVHWFNEAMDNPYISRGPVRSPELFFGRSHELQEVASFLRGNQSVSIVGPRKIGKTSLLFQLKRPETWAAFGLGDDNLFIYLDCEVLGEGAHADIFGQFVGEMAAALDERGLPPEPALDAAAAKPSRLSFEGAVRKLNQRGLRVVLILDEFERLSTNPSLDVNFFNALRSAAGRYQLVFLTASARPLIELTYSGKSQEILSSPFFNIFAPLFLGLLSEADARQLIQEPAQKAGLTFPAATADFICAFAGGHPLILQIACFHACDTPADTNELERRALQELQAHFEYYWRNLTPAEQEILRKVAETADKETSDTTLRGLLRDLLQKCLLVAENGVYRYPSRAWETFVSGQISTAPSHSQIGGMLTGMKLGPYEVLELLGRGGMSEVYKGRHPRLDRTVAIKVLPASLAAEADFRIRFEQEARAVAALKHPNIVQVFDFGDVEGTYYMVMEFVAGRDLTHALRERGKLALIEARAIARDIAGALDYAHAEGLVHRDIKPSNVMLDPGQGASAPRAVLTDFGIAKIVSGGAGTTKTGIVGTLDYMAPEQIRNAGEVDARADVYALGVLLFEMLTGHLPFAGDNPAAMLLAHLNTPAPDPRTLNPALSAPTAAAILRALAKDPAERFRTAGELVMAVE